MLNPKCKEFQTSIISEECSRKMEERKIKNETNSRSTEKEAGMVRTHALNWRKQYCK